MNDGILVSGYRQSAMPYALLGQPAPIPLIGHQSIALDPRLIQGLSAWYDASDVSAMSGSTSGGTTVANNSPVLLLRDKSASGNNGTAPSTPAAPTLVANSLNGRPGLSFDGGDVINCSGALMTVPFTLFVVGRASVTGSTRICGVGSTRSVGPFASSNTQWGFFQSVTGASVQSFGVSATAASVLCLTVNTSNQAIYFGNGEQSSSSTIATMTPGQFAVGNAVAASVGTFTGVFYELLSFSNVLSAWQRNAVTRWLGAKWGIVCT